MSDILALISLVVSVLTAAWTVMWAVYLHRHEKTERERERRERAEEKQEKIEASVSLCSDAKGYTVLEVRVYNPCQFPLQIDSVDLKFWKKHEKPPEGFMPEYETALPLQTILFQPQKRAAGNGRKQTVALSSASPSCYLLPRTAAMFVLPPELHFKLQEAAALPPENVWISICTPGGEVGGVAGAQILPFIQAVLKSGEVQQQVNGTKPICNGAGQ